MAGALQKMVLVITSARSSEVLERWTFDLHTDKAAIQGGYTPSCALVGSASLYNPTKTGLM